MLLQSWGEQVEGGSVERQTVDESRREPVTPTWAQRKQKWAGRCYTLVVLASLSVLGRGSRVAVRVRACACVCRCTGERPVSIVWRCRPTGRLGDY